MKLIEENQKIVNCVNIGELYGVLSVSLYRL